MTAGEQLDASIDSLIAVMTKALDAQNKAMTIIAKETSDLKARVTALEEAPWEVEPAPEPEPEPEPEPLPNPPLGFRGGALQVPGSTISLRDRVPKPAGLAPTSPNNIFNDARPYIGETEVYKSVDRPIYFLAMDTAQWARWQADRYLVYGIVPSPGFHAIMDGWVAMDPVLSIPQGDVVEGGGQISTTCNTMPGMLFACADVGYAPPGLARWINHIQSLLTVRNWRANHNFRLSALITYCAAQSALSKGEQVPSLVVDQVRLWLNDHVGRTISTDGTENKEEQDRQRSIHYQLIEVQTMALIEVWIRRNEGNPMDGWVYNELTRYLRWLHPHILACIDANPTPSTPPYRYTNSAGNHVDIGPISKDLFGPAMEWVKLLGWNDWHIPSGFIGKTMIYKYYGEVPVNR